MVVRSPVVRSSMAALRVACILTLLASLVLALPTEPITRQTRRNGPIKRQANSEPIKSETEPEPIIKQNETSPAELASRDAENILKEAEKAATESAATTESTAQKNTTEPQRKVVTYILGQPSKGTLQSPAELLSPDRYEFYTFDDDGKIIKKLMNVEEIQRIIANSKGGLPADTQHTGDYYQVLTVTPDVESLPAVKINPHEPLFSIHDVIASVQNVLKAEINQKMTQPPPALVIDGFQNAHLVPEGEETPKLPPLTKNETLMLEKLKVEEKTTADEGTEGSITEEATSAPEESTVEAKTEPFTIVVVEQTTAKVSATTQAPVTTETPTKKPTTVTKKPIIVVATKKPQASSTVSATTTTKKQEAIVLDDILAELKQAPLKVTEPSVGKPTMVQILKVTSSVSQSSSPVSQVPAFTTLRTTTSTKVPLTTTTTSEPIVPAEKTTFGPIVVTELKENGIESSSTELPTTEETPEFPPIIVPEEIPLSLLDAHPGLVSNETFAEDSPPLPGSLFSIENQLFDSVTQNRTDLTQVSNFSTAASALNEVQIPMNQDLAESVSSVLSQIANEISLNSLNFERNVETTTIPYTTTTDEATEITFSTTEEAASTILPASWLKNAEDVIIDETTSEFSTTPEDVSKESTTYYTPTTLFKPQNKPRPFSKLSTTEGSLTTEINELEPSTVIPELESRTEYELTTAQPDNDATTITTSIQEETTTVRLEKTSTTVESEKKNDPANSLQVIESNGNSSSSIEIIQEAETGRIPRPTQSPEEITTRPGSLKITTAAASQSTNKGNFINISSTTAAVTRTTPQTPVPSSAKPTIASVPTTVLTTTTTTTTTTEPPPTTVREALEILSESESGSEETTTEERNPDDDAEKISISFLPMVIRTSTAAPEEEPIDLAKTSDDLKLPLSDEILESKGIPEEIVEKSAPIASSHKVVIAAITEEKAADPQVETVSRDPPPAQKHNARPQTYVKPTKPVFIKPTKGKPQASETKPTKPPRPASSEEEQRPYETPLLSSPSAIELDQAPDENLGLEATTIHLEPDVRDFVELCNELAFSLWSSITHNGLSFVRSVVVSPFAVTSLLAMVFLGARGPTSGQMNDILKLDDVVTFNPHLVFRNVTESLVIARHPGVSTAAFVRELYSDRSKGKLLDFYKERAQQFYDGHVEEVNFKAIGETLRRQTNHLVKRQTWGKVKDFLQGSTLMLRAPLAAFSANIFQADCSRASTKDRDGEMYFVVLPSNRLRRLVPIPAAVWRDDFLAGYEPNLDATAAAVGSVGGIVSTIFVMPGQQGLIAPGDSLARLEHHLLGSSYRRGHWDRLMRSLLRRPGLELQVPRITHKSVVNVTASLQKMGLRDLFSAEKADLTGLNGLANDLHLSDMVQVNQFSTCGDDSSSSLSHTEFYPATPLQRREKSADNVFAESIESLFAVSDFEDPSIAALPLELRPRQARIPSSRSEGRAPDPPRLKLDRPFLFFVRHNPTGLILHVGRFNPRLMH